MCESLGIVIGWSSSKIVSGSRALPPRWLPQCSCVVIESSFDPGERLQAPGSLWLKIGIYSLFRGDVTSSNNESTIFRRWKSNVKWRMFHRLNDKGDNSLTEIPRYFWSKLEGPRSKDVYRILIYVLARSQGEYSLFQASGYFGQRIISLVIEAVKHSPF
jgi:hypothetical protein